MIKYIGSKRLLLQHIVRAVSLFPDVQRVGDVFSGTARVGHALKAAGYAVSASDHNAYAHVLAQCYVAADRDAVLSDASSLIAEFNALPGRADYFTETFCLKSRYVHPQNGERIDAIREAIARKGLPPDLNAVMLVSLMEAADRVDSTTGVQMAYLKQWAKRAHNPLQLRMPDVLAGAGLAMNLDAKEAASIMDVDLMYFDPPYNQHSYRGNYHVSESLVRWDKPEVYGKACKRIDCKEHRSVFNSKRTIHNALAEVIGACRAPHVLVSFSNEGFVTYEQMRALLSSFGEVAAIGVDFKRYVGAQIGIHNLKGEKVGQVSHLRNTEYLYFASRIPGVAERVRDGMLEVGAEGSATGLRAGMPAGRGALRVDEKMA